MAESNRGPLIAIHKNSCCVQFAIDRKYRETVIILGNFIRQKIDEITCGKKLSKSLQEAVNKRRKTRNINADARVPNSDETKHLKALARSISSRQEMNKLIASRMKEEGVEEQKTANMTL